VDPAKAGEDLRTTLRQQLVLNKRKLPRLIAENMLILSFSHSWPDSAKEGLPSRICLWERWIWFPIVLFTLFRSFLYLKRRKVAIVPVLSALMTLGMYASHGGIMEGRYRKPMEPLLMLSVFWLIEAKMSRPRVRLPPTAKAPS
jgi:hypothetical protein